MENVIFTPSNKLVEQVGNVEFGKVKRSTGRPINVESKRQRRIAELNEKRVNGEVKRGRPVGTVNPESKRQQRINELNEKRAAGILKVGRPKGSGAKAKTETVEVEVVTVG